MMSLLPVFYMMIGPMVWNWLLPVPVHELELHKVSKFAIHVSVYKTGLFFRWNTSFVWYLMPVAICVYLLLVAFASVATRAATELIVHAFVFNDSGVELPLFQLMWKEPHSSRVADLMYPGVSAGMVAAEIVIAVCVYGFF